MSCIILEPRRHYGGVVVIWLGIAVVLLAGAAIFRIRAGRMALRAFHRSHARIDRYKLTRKAVVRETLLADAEIAAAVSEHAAESGTAEEAAWRRVETYIDEIVPFFNILTYYRFGLVVSRALLNLFYKVSAEYAGSRETELPRDSIVVYLMNHRSNADYAYVGLAVVLCLALVLWAAGAL